MRRSALSRCFCWRVCSFWRLVKLDRPRPGIAISNRFSLIERPLSGYKPPLILRRSRRGWKSRPFKTSREPLPAGFAGLTRVPLVIVAAAAASATEALSTASAAARRVGLRFRFVDLQGAAAEFGSIQRRYRLVRFRRIGHLDEAEAAGAAGFAVGDNADFLDCAMRLKQAAQLWFGGAVR